MTKAHIMTGGRYPVLRALAILYMLGALAALCYGIYWVGWSLFAAPGSMGERSYLALQALAATFFGVITVLAVAELIKLMIDVEHNTRMSAMGAASTNGGVAVVGTASTDGGHTNRVTQLDDESAEAALLRGH